MIRHRQWWKHVLARTHNRLYRYGCRLGDPSIAGWDNVPGLAGWVGAAMHDALRRLGYWGPVRR